MAIQWFFQTSAGQPSGPVDSGELRRLAKAGIVRPDTLVRRGDSSRWVHAEKVRGLFQQSTPAHSSSLGAPPPLPKSGSPSRDVSGESPIRHGLRAAALNAESEKAKRVWPVTWAAILVGSGTVLLLLWTMVFRGGSEPQQQVEKDQPPLAAAQSAESGSSTPVQQAASQPTKTTPTAAPAVKPKSAPATDNVKVLDLADLAELVRPSVVQVNVTGPEKAATGSGFVLDKQGTIVTNYHVIEDATAGRIVFSDRTGATIIGYLGVWPEKDIALIRVKCPPEKLHPFRLATSVPRQGERVAAFGSPLGLQKSVSEGIVSAVRESKELRALVPTDVNARLIQTTTPISHGNSGGPLVDMKGMVVGVNTMTFRPLGGENVNFAVAAVELPPLLLAKNETPSPLPANDPAATGVRRIMRRACGHIRAGNYDSAIADYTDAIRLDPKKALAYCGRGWAHHGKHDYDRAIADCTDAIRLDPKEAHAYWFRGNAYHGKHDYDRAIADYTDAIRLDPKKALAYYLRGNAYRDKYDYDSAIADYTDAIRLEPKEAHAYYLRGNAYCDKHDYDSAIADYTDAIRLDPKKAHAYCLRGYAYQKKGNRAAAKRDFAKAKRLGFPILIPIGAQ